MVKAITFNILIKEILGKNAIIGIRNVFQGTFPNKVMITECVKNERFIIKNEYVEIR